MEGTQSRKNIFFDIDLIFEIRYLQLSLARRASFIDSSFLRSLYNLPLEQGFKTLNCTAPQTEIIDYLKTVRFKIDGFALLQSHRSSTRFLIGDIEPWAYSFIVPSEYSDILQVSSSDLITHTSLTTSSKVYTYREALHEELIKNGIESELIPLKGAVSFTYSLNKIPWNNYHELKKPMKILGSVVKGFGRGSRELGFPTANIDFRSNLDLVPGIYAGFCMFDGIVYKAAFSIGWCPFYNNQAISYEVYVVGKFEHTLLGKELECELLFYLRSESNFRKLEDLIHAITMDVELTDRLLDSKRS